MKKELEKIYNPQVVENKIYQKWEESGAFNPDNLTGEPYSIVMPPPNVTGVLHLGHALENSLMDSMIRFQRLRGKKTLLIPGTDHAAVATQAKVEKILVEKGQAQNPREELGREKLLDEIREFAENSKATILKQIRRMGTSCDWSRLAYTFDDDRSQAVNQVFEKMYNDNLIYRGFKVINWSVKGQSTCSDDELVYIERPAKLYTFKYSKDFPITIATTRPETKLGDTAVAVNPHDPRYQKFIGQIFTAQVGAAKPLEIKIIADEHVDPNFGTGALGVTPAHSAVDFEIFERQKAKNDPIEMIEVIGRDGKMTAQAGPDYQGLGVSQARQKFVHWLKDQNLLEKEEDIIQSVGTSDRFGDVVEALPMVQWFVDVNKKIPHKNKSLKELMREAVSVGHNQDESQKININPKRFEKVYFNWIDDLHDWCISRQIWWGHQIPVWYRDQEIYCGSTAPKGEGWQQDGDTLDTWFSSGLWTFSTLGWPQKSQDLEIFYPTSWIQMGYEILFFWMARMILMSTYTLDTIPFRDVYIHGMLRDEKGQKFSKSLGNSLDPLEIIDKYGCDALRLSLLSGVSPGNDSKFYEEKVESARNFINKLWNISRFVIQTTEKQTPQPSNNLTFADNWIIVELKNLTKETTDHLEKFQFSQAIERLREFTWNEFADWYLEVSKFEDNKPEKDWILKNCLKNLLQLWHPFIPFVTEHIWQQLEEETDLISEKWPETDVSEPTKEAEQLVFNLIKEIIVSIRNLRAENKIDPTKKIKVIFDLKNQTEYFGQDGAKIISDHENLIKKLRTGVSEIEIVSDFKEIKNTVSQTVSGINILIPLEGLLDSEKEKIKIQKEIENLEKYAEGLRKRLANENFTQKAPEKVISQQKESLEKTVADLESLKDNLKKL